MKIPAKERPCPRCDAPPGRECRARAPWQSWADACRIPLAYLHDERRESAYR